MCGIAGGIALSTNRRPDPDKVRTMAGLLAHRGPDGEGLWISPSGRACLAHRRLSVIDIAGGGQPMVDGSGTRGIVFNGEIYNYLELRDALARDGETFRTSSDTEVLLRLVTRDGEECVEALGGMFAFVAWDDEKGTLVAARDRIGKKPLFFVMEDGCLYFASSLGALRAGIGGTRALDAEALDRYLALGYIPAPRTIYQGICKLPAATVMMSHRDSVVLRRYWDIAAEPEPLEGSYEQAMDRLEELLETAVRIRLRSDVPLGIMLSGGIDSSLVTALAVRQSAHPVDTFSIGFGERSYDESDQAAEVARHLGARHHILRLESDLTGLIPRAVAHFGEPYADSSALPSWALAGLARRHVTVALGGDGGDEGFSGYEWYATARRLGDWASRIPRGPVRAAASAATAAGLLGNARRIGRFARGLGFLAAEDFGARFAALRCCLGAGEAAFLYRRSIAARAELRRQDAEQSIRSAFRRASGSPLRKMRYADLETYLADDLMPKIDVASMAHGLEVRAPLLDHAVVRFGLSLPDEYLVDERGGKRILRDLLLRYLPRPLIERPKRGFTVPLAPWFRGGLRPRIESLAGSERLRGLGLFDPSGIRRLADEHIAGARDHSQRLYALLVLDQWLEASAAGAVDPNLVREAAE
ncbi:asparagine synthase (glutamine-hydrolyzing) [Microvirga sp. M2]|uniref:asparagine synthase (glutamine-hydrolyzing) n=1 Tax=Microvirga sp. M2 TaxID=3073270 RepID=UPI0039C0DCA2